MLSVFHAQHVSMCFTELALPSADQLDVAVREPIRFTAPHNIHLPSHLRTFWGWKGPQIRKIIHVSI